MCGDRIHPSPKATLDVADGPLAQPGSIGELGLGQPGCDPVVAHLVSQAGVGHR
jgi:hypothetical protein